MAATFTAGGLASGLDTNSIIDSLTKIRAQSVDLLKSRQAAYTMQVSSIGDIANRLSGLETAVKALQTQGALGVSVAGSLDGLSVTPTSQAQAGRYTVQVTALASAAKDRSAGFDGSSAPLTAGSLDFSVNGTPSSVTVAAGSSLADVAAAINQQASGVSAVVLSDGKKSYLSVTNRDTGFTLGGQSSDALQISGTAAAQFGFTEIVPAANAHVSIDQLDFERRSNTVTDALPGVTMMLSKPGDEQDLVLTNDTATTAKNLQGFVDAYNLVLKSVQKALDVSSGTDRSSTLAGDGAMRSLQGALQALSSRIVGTTTVRTLADLGVKTARDGSLSLDSTTLDKAVARDPASVNALFATATDGLSDVTTALCEGYTNSVDGVLTTRTNGIHDSITRLGKDIDREQAAVDRYHDLLVAQFTAMESVVGGLKATGNYLTQQEAVKK